MFDIVKDFTLGKKHVTFVLSGPYIERRGGLFLLNIGSEMYPHSHSFELVGWIYLLGLHVLSFDLIIEHHRDSNLFDKKTGF